MLSKVTKKHRAKVPSRNTPVRIGTSEAGPAPGEAEAVLRNWIVMVQ